MARLALCRAVAHSDNDARLGPFDTVSIHAGLDVTHCSRVVGRRMVAVLTMA